LQKERIGEESEGHNGKRKAGTLSASFEESRHEGFFHQSASSVSPSSRGRNDYLMGGVQPQLRESNGMMRASSEAVNNVDECYHGLTESLCPRPRHEILISRDLVEVGGQHERTVVVCSRFRLSLWHCSVKPRHTAEQANGGAR
jgi:hypothetical protein